MAPAPATLLRPRSPQARASTMAAPNDNERSLAERLRKSPPLYVPRSWPLSSYVMPELLHVRAFLNSKLLMMPRCRNCAL